MSEAGDGDSEGASGGGGEAGQRQPEVLEHHTLFILLTCQFLYLR